jgi:GNAT superfamily N-acetyltransferase
MQVTIRPLDTANDADVRGAFRVHADSSVRDVPDFPPPTLVDYRSRLEHPWPGNAERQLVADAGGEIVAALTVSMPTLDNLHLAELDVVVHPDHRRRGLGRMLFEHGLAVAREEGRRTVTGNYVTQLPDGPERDAGFAAFAEAMQTKPALPEVRRRLDVTTADTAAWDRLYEEALPLAKGYSPVRWIGAAPDEYVEDVAMLDGRLLIDAPMGDLDIEPEKVDVARVRANEATQAIRGRRAYHAGMRHDETNRLVAWTAINFDVDNPDHAWQQITIVDPGHRGHRLGLLVKIENLRQALEHEPATRVIDTWNAAENTHMIAINETLGYRPVDGWVEWQRPV